MNVGVEPLGRCFVIEEVLSWITAVNAFTFDGHFSDFCLMRCEHGFFYSWRVYCRYLFYYMYKRQLYMKLTVREKSVGLAKRTQLALFICTSLHNWTRKTTTYCSLKLGAMGSPFCYTWVESFPSCQSFHVSINVSRVVVVVSGVPQDSALGLI